MREREHPPSTCALRLLCVSVLTRMYESAFCSFWFGFVRLPLLSLSLRVYRKTIISTEQIVRVKMRARAFICSYNHSACVSYALCDTCAYMGRHQHTSLAFTETQGACQLSVALRIFNQLPAASCCLLATHHTQEPICC